MKRVTYHNLLTLIIIGTALKIALDTYHRFLWSRIVLYVNARIGESDGDKASP